jgi:hypothetical protein
MNQFSVDVSFDEKWLVNALAAARRKELVRVTVVISDAGPNVKYKAAALGGGDAEYLVAAIAGDFTKESA